jgi:hypothetical protein
MDKSKATKCRNLVQKAMVYRECMYFRYLYSFTFFNSDNYDKFLSLIQDILTTQEIKKEQKHYRITLSEDQWKQLKKQYGDWNPPPKLLKDYLIKSINNPIPEVDNFKKFIKTITRTSIEDEQPSLRPELKKTFTIKGSGVQNRTTRSPQYTSEEKQFYSKPQSVSLVTESVKQSVFKFLSDKSKVLIGAAVDPGDTLFNDRFLLYDWDTYKRPFDFDNKQEADIYWHKLSDVPRILYDQLGSFKQALEQSRSDKTKEDRTIKRKLEEKAHNLNKRDPTGYNEVLARIRWNVQSSWLIAFDNDIETRIFIQGYAAQLKSALIKRSSALSKRNVSETFYPVDMDYEVPIRFYLPGCRNDNEIYDIFDQSLDKTEGLKQYSYNLRIDKKILFEIIHNNDTSLLWCAVNLFLKNARDSERANLVAALLARSLQNNQPACAEILLQIAEERSIRPLLLFLNKDDSFKEILNNFLLDYTQINFNLNFNQKSYQQCLEYAVAQLNLKLLDILFSQETLFQEMLEDEHFISSNALLPVNNSIKTFLQENSIPWPVILKLNDLSFESFNVNSLRKILKKEEITKFKEDREKLKISVLKKIMPSHKKQEQGTSKDEKITDENITLETFVKLDQLIRSVLDLSAQDKNIKDTPKKMLEGLIDYCLNIYIDSNHSDLSERYNTTISLLENLHSNLSVGHMPSFFNPEKRLANAIDRIIKDRPIIVASVSDLNRPSTSRN